MCTVLCKEVSSRIKWILLHQNIIWLKWFYWKQKVFVISFLWEEVMENMQSVLRDLYSIKPLSPNNFMEKAHQVEATLILLKTLLNIQKRKCLNPVQEMSSFLLRIINTCRCNYTFTGVFSKLDSVGETGSFVAVGARWRCALWHMPFNMALGKWTKGNYVWKKLNAWAVERERNYISEKIQENKEKAIIKNRT